MERAFKVGDVVRLVTGGPVMAVNNIINDLREGIYYTCIWFNSTSDYSCGDFKAALLIDVVEEGLFHGEPEKPTKKKPTKKKPTKKKSSKRIVKITKPKKMKAYVA